MDETPQSDTAFLPPRASSFPGGKVRLPWLNPVDRPGEPVIDVVETAFLKAPAPAAAPEPPSGFTGYFTYESLFEAPAEGDPDFRGEDPYEVLKVDSSADWPTIVSAHRALAKEFHPDRFVGHPAEVVANAEAEIKRINLAYSELRRRRTESDDRRSGADRRTSPR